MGASFDPPSRNQAWAEAEGFAFDLWTDEGRELALTYGAAATASQPFAGRVTVLLDENGELLLEYPVVSVGTHPQEVLDDCELLFGN